MASRRRRSCLRLRGSFAATATTLRPQRQRSQPGLVWYQLVEGTGAYGREGFVGCHGSCGIPGLVLARTRTEHPRPVVRRSFAMEEVDA